MQGLLSGLLSGLLVLTFLLGSTISLACLGLDPVFLLLLCWTGAGLSFSSSEESRAAKKFD